MRIPRGCSAEPACKQFKEICRMVPELIAVCSPFLRSFANWLIQYKKNMLNLLGIMKHQHDHVEGVRP